MDFFTKDEVAAMRFVYATAPARAQLLGVGGSPAWQFEHYADFTYATLPDFIVTESMINEVVRWMRPTPRSSYLIHARSNGGRRTVSRLAAATGEHVPCERHTLWPLSRRVFESRRDGLQAARRSGEEARAGQVICVATAGRTCRDTLVVLARRTMGGMADGSG